MHARWMPSLTHLKTAGGFSTSAQVPAAGSACWMRRSARRHSTSQRIWCRASSPAEKQRSAGATEATEDDPAIGMRDLLARGFRGPASGGADVLCGIAASGRTPYVLGAVDEANRQGARRSASVALRVRSSHAREDRHHASAGPEVIAGSTRLKAGTATKLVLNMLTTGSSSG